MSYNAKFSLHIWLLTLSYFLAVWNSFRLVRVSFLQHMDVPGLGTESKLELQPIPQLQQCQILNSLCQARDRTNTSTETSQIINLLCHSGNSPCVLWTCSYSFFFLMLSYFWATQISQEFLRFSLPQPWRHLYLQRALDLFIGERCLQIKIWVLGLLFFFFSFFFLGLHLQQCGSFQARDQIGATAASLRHSQSNMGSESCL